jgi:Fe-S-cluster containining protein
MSVPELFHHENRFVGSLGLRRVHRHKIGERLPAAESHYALTTDDMNLLNDLAAMQLYKTNMFKNQGEYDFSLMTQALDYESQNKCPALGEDLHCTIQHDRKPSVCTLAPFDSLYPDSLQNIVLLNRNFGENCIIKGEQTDFPIVIKDRQVVNRPYQSALEQRRFDLQLEKKYWGQTVFAMLETQVLSQPAEMAKIPLDKGWLLLPMVPVLMVLATISDHCRARCLQYIDSQIKLIDLKIAQALARKTAEDKPITQQFRFIKNTYHLLRPQLTSAQNLQQISGVDGLTDNLVHAIEDYIA